MTETIRNAKLEELSRTQRTLEAAETAVGHLRDRKWELVEDLKSMGHDFTATTEGMNVVLSAPPSMSF